MEDETALRMIKTEQVKLDLLMCTYLFFLIWIFSHLCKPIWQGMYLYILFLQPKTNLDQPAICIVPNET